MKGSVSGSCAAILRTRGLMVNVTSTISSSVGSQFSAQRTHLYSACFTVLSVAPESRTPPQAGQRIFQDMSKMPSRAPCRKAAIGKGEDVDTAEITVRRILDELLDRAYRLRLR